MLINTLFLFLREVLSIFFLCAILVAMIPQYRVRRNILVPGILAGVVLCVLLQIFIDDISQAVGGAGLELTFFASMSAQMFSLLALLFTLNNFQEKAAQVLLGFMLALLIMTNGVDFFVFFGSLWVREGLAQALVSGLVIGVGISASLATLVYFSLRWCRHYVPLSLYIILALFFAGHFADAMHLMAQIGWIDSDVIWSTQTWLSDQSEFAQILSSLFGYEATPSVWQVGAYVGSLALLLFSITLRRQTLRAALYDNEVPQ